MRRMRNNGPSLQMRKLQGGELLFPARATLDREELALRVYKGDMFTPPNPFRTNAGRFWRIPAAQPYLRSRLALVEALLKQPSREAVEAAMFHSLSMLDLARLDRIGVRRLMPAIYLRLGRDQEAYDFIKWWYFAMQDCRNDFEPTTPYLTMKGEDIFEPIVFHLAEREVVIPDLSHMVALTLIKIRVLLDLRCLEDVIGDANPQNYWPTLQSCLTTCGRQFQASNITANHPKFEQLVVHGLADSIENLEDQVSTLYSMLVKENEHFWCRLLSPIDSQGRDWLELDPAEIQCEGCGEKAEVLQMNYKSWAETPGALAVIAELALGDSKSCTARAKAIDDASQ
ncbi:hypothetical protein LTR08_000886 [Meristemomyces frigidus]|nr:hypothetical protein LTR08_000886 [Meristemomyces frigidus]